MGVVLFLIGLAIGMVIGAFAAEVGWWLHYLDEEER